MLIKNCNKVIITCPTWIREFDRINENEFQVQTSEIEIRNNKVKKEISLFTDEKTYSNDDLENIHKYYYLLEILGFEIQFE